MVYNIIYIYSQKQNEPQTRHTTNQNVSLSIYHVSLGKLLYPLKLTFSIHLIARTTCTYNSVPGLRYLPCIKYPGKCCGEALRTLEKDCIFSPQQRASLCCNGLCLQRMDNKQQTLRGVAYQSTLGKLLLKGFKEIYCNAPPSLMVSFTDSHLKSIVSFLSNSHIDF